MTWIVVFEAPAQVEIAEAFAWYEEKSYGLVLACLHHRRSPARWPGN